MEIVLLKYRIKYCAYPPKGVFESIFEDLRLGFYF